MKAIVITFAFAFSLAAYADAPGYGYPQNQPPPIEELEPEQPGQPCVAPCVPRPRCIPPYGCGNVYNQVPQKVCQVVEAVRTRWGGGWVIVRFGQQLTARPMPYGQVEADAYHYRRTPDMDGRPICDVVITPRGAL